jgi:hypothetical protein
MCFHFSNLSQLPDFDETWYDRYDIDGNPKSVIFNLAQPAIRTWRACVFVRWK